jgi:pyridoxal 5'-phosphate synthase pdxS subunit
VFVGSGVFLSSDPKRRARAIVEAVTHWEDAKHLAEISAGLGDAMRGTQLASLPPAERMAGRGW